MQQDTPLPGGIRFFRPREGAPSFVKGSISIQPQQFVQFLKDNKEYFKKNSKDGLDYISLDLLVSKKGGLYLKTNTYKREEKESEMRTSDGSKIPFPNDGAPEYTEADMPF